MPTSHDDASGLCLFIDGCDLGTDVTIEPNRARGGQTVWLAGFENDPAREFHTRRIDLCVTQGQRGTSCTCGDAGLCRHVRALRSVGLIR